jgi:hypothetical protein
MINDFNNNVTVNKMLLTISSCFVLRIYYTLGEEVAVLLDKELTTGSYEVEWNASELPSGVFFY